MLLIVGPFARDDIFGRHNRCDHAGSQCGHEVDCSARYTSSGVQSVAAARKMIGAGNAKMCLPKTPSDLSKVPPRLM